MQRRNFTWIATLAPLGLSLLAALPARAATIRVPANQPTITAALSAAQPGDTIMVADGTYYEHDISTHGKLVTLQSQNGPTHCIIDGQGANCVFYIACGETPSTIIKGFTIQNGSGKAYGNTTSGTIQMVGTFGGGMNIIHSSPTILGCIFSGNTAHGADQTGGNAFSSGGRGGGLYMEDSNAVIMRCAFIGNAAVGGRGGTGSGPGRSLHGGDGGNGASGVGGAIALDASSPTLTDCTFVGNTAVGGAGGNGGFGSLSGGAGGGGGAALGGALNLSGSSPTLVNCVFRANRAVGGGGGAGANGILSGGLGGAGNSSQGGALCVNGSVGGEFLQINPGPSAPALSFCTFNGNGAAGGFGGIGGRSDYFRMRNTPGISGIGLGGALEVGVETGPVALTDDILYADIADTSPEIDNHGNYGDLHCDIAGGLGGSLDADPHFVSPTDLHLKHGSPCVGAGIALAGVTTDLDGRTRRNPPSMGAYDTAQP